MKELFIQQQNSTTTYAIYPSDSKLAAQLTASTAEEIENLDADYALFSGTKDFYVDFSGAEAAIPISSSFAPVTVELNPTIRYIKDIESISVIAPEDCIVTVAFYNKFG